MFQGLGHANCDHHGLQCLKIRPFKRRHITFVTFATVPLTGGMFVFKSFFSK